MKTKKKFLLNLVAITVVFLFNSKTSNAQQSQSGSRLPDLEFKMLNYATPTLKLSELKGKIIILDFWATWCSPCIAEFPRMDTLRKKFAGKIEIIPITKENEAITSAFIKRYHKLNGLRITSAVGNDQLHKLLKITTFPHYVWLDKEGRLLGWSDSKKVNEANIMLALNSNSNISKVIKTSFDRNPSINPNLPIFIGDKPQVKLDRGDTLYYKDDSLHSFIITKYKPTIKLSSMGWPKRGTYGGNMNLRWLLLNIYSDLTYSNNPYSRMRFEMSEDLIQKYGLKYSNKEVLPEDEPIYFKNFISFEAILKVPTTLDSSITLNREDRRKLADFLKKDITEFLARYNYPFRVKQELARKKVLSLVRINPKIDLTNTNGNYQLEKTMVNFKGFKVPSNILTSTLRGYYWQHTNFPPLIDKTGYKNPIDFDIEADMSNFSAVQRELQKLGLQIIEEFEDYEQIVFYSN